ncbi:MAG: ATP-binding protein, partial [Nanoarchaeota archaeon]
MREKNPFVFGKVVRGSNFCNRNDEIEKIHGIIQSKNNLVIISPRRYGKTSLVINALEGKKIPFVFIDCFSISTEELLLERLTLSYLEKLQKGDILEKLKYLAKTLDMEYTFSAEGVSIKVKKYNDVSLDKLLKEITKEHVLVFDEFQELFAVNSDLVKRLRSIMQFIQQSFIFLGSRKHLLLFLFSDQKSPFYNFASIMNLLKIPPKEWTVFIKKKTEKTGVLFEQEDIDAILSSAEEIPFY